MLYVKCLHNFAHSSKDELHQAVTIQQASTLGLRKRGASSAQCSGNPRHWNKCGMCLEQNTMLFAKAAVKSSLRYDVTSNIWMYMTQLIYDWHTYLWHRCSRAQTSLLVKQMHFVSMRSSAASFNFTNGLAIRRPESSISYAKICKIQIWAKIAKSEIQNTKYKLRILDFGCAKMKLGSDLDVLFQVPDQLGNLAVVGIPFQWSINFPGIEWRQWLFSLSERR